MNPPTPRPILVALGPEAQALRLIHRAFWMAREVDAPWIAIHVEVPDQEDDDEREQAQLWLLEAERLGGRTLWVKARTVAMGLLDTLRELQPSDLLVGRTPQHWLSASLRHALAQELERRVPACRIHTVPLEPEVRHALRVPPRSQWAGAMASTVLVLGACTGVSWILPPQQPLPAIFLIYLLGTALLAERHGLLFGLGSVAISTFIFHRIFSHHPGQLEVGAGPLIALFVAILALGQYGIALTERMRQQTRALRRREALMACLLLLGTRLARVTNRAQVDEILSQLAPRMLHRQVRLRQDSAGGHPPLEVEGPALDPHGEDLMQAMGAQVALALERMEAHARLEEARLAHETDQVRSGLLEAIGHDLRTPLAAIQGAASSLLLTPDAPHRTEMLAMICGESERLNQLLNNLLDLTRFESLKEVPNQDWIALEEVVASVLHRLGPAASSVQLKLDERLPLVKADGVLLEQLLLNLLANAFRHAPGSPVALSVHPQQGQVILQVQDRGPGVPDDLKQQVFDKFFRLPGRHADGGAGLGLAICDAIARLHGGRIWVEDAHPCGATFCVALPATEDPEPPADLEGALP